MKRRTRSLVLVIGLVLALVAAFYVPSAFAHTSSYCGHGHSGSHAVGGYSVHYVRHFNSAEDHFHVYNHYTGPHTYTHTVTKYCGVS